MPRILRIILPFIFLSCIIMGCQSEEKAPLFSVENLPKTSFQFPANQDTILIAKEGTIFHIPANAFVDENDKIYEGIVELELLEAFTLEDMILGNLTTVTDEGRLLESSGMFRFSIKGNGNLLKVNPATKVMMTIPAVHLEEDTQFFYGNLDEREDLVWSVANLMRVDTSNKRLLLGRNLLLRECASCHNFNITDDMTGPALAWATKRWKNMDELIAFTRNSEGFAASGNLRARVMITWAASSMTAFNHLSEEEIKAIYYYIDETARARKIDSTGQAPLSDAYFQTFLDRQDSIRSANDSIRIINNQLRFSKASNLLFQLSSKLDKPFNWVNIDRYMSEDVPKQKDLQVKINKDLNIGSTEVRIIFPEGNTIVNAYPSIEKDYYSFTEHYQLESTPFSIGEKAYLMAVSTLDDEIYLALKPITIGDNNLEELDLKLITKEELIAKIKATF